MAAHDDGDVKKVVIVGAGFGGLATASALEAHRKTAGTSCNVTLVDRAQDFSIGGTWQFAASGRSQLSTTKIPLANAALTYTSVRPGEAVKSIDLVEKTVMMEQNDEKLPYDYLVLSTGTESRADLVPGLAESTGWDLSRWDHIPGIEATLNGITSGDLLIMISATPYKCPPLPFEYAFVADEVLTNRGVRNDVTITIACPVPWPFGGPAVETGFKERMDAKGIRFLAGYAITEVTPEGAMFANEESLPYDALFYVPPQLAPRVLSTLTNRKGLVPVDLKTNLTAGSDCVFAIGDCCQAMLPVVNKPHPKAGEFAAQMGSSVADYIVASLQHATKLPVPSTRSAVCYAEAGWGAGLGVNPDLDKCMVGGPPSFKLVVNEDHGVAAKVEWINEYITRFFGENPSLTFQPQPYRPL